MNKPKPILLVSSTVYGIEELLDRVYTILTTFGYEVWMSHRGTIPLSSGHTAFENCIQAVERCDLFLGIITPWYGSGKVGDDPSITHQEFRKAIELRKPRWFLAHDHVVFARKFLSDLGYADAASRKSLALKKGSSSLSDLRVIDLYEEAILNSIPLPERKGNWVQGFSTDEDALRFAAAQFSRFQEVESFVHEQLADPSSVLEKTGRKKGGKP